MDSTKMKDKDKIKYKVWNKYKTKLNIGAGNRILKGFVNLDIKKLEGIDVSYDLNKYPYPFEENTFDYVLADVILEMLDDIVKPLEEIHRISKNGAIIEITVALAPTTHAFRDPLHKSFFTYRTFDYFLESSNVECLNYYSKARFKIIKRKIKFHHRLSILNPLINCNQKFTRFMCEFFSQLFPPAFLEVELEVVKDKYSDTNEKEVKRNEKIHCKDEKHDTTTH